MNFSIFLLNTDTYDYFQGFYCLQTIRELIISMFIKSHSKIKYYSKETIRNREKKT